MRYAFYLTSAIAVLITGIGCTTQAASDGRSVAGTVVTVQYVNPQHFTDFSIHNRDIRYSASVFTQELTEDLGRVMKSRFPGDTLTLRFTKIDLAGHGSVRVVRTHRPARLSFDYLLRDHAGRAVASGSQTLVDTLPLGHSAYAVSSGPLPVESRMLQRWLRSLSVAR
jgi:hypothetical protein